MIVMNKKGSEAEGIKFNWQIVALLVLFVTVLVVAFVIIIPRITSGGFSGSGTSFGKYLWDILSGG
jgi:hypothetical protein